jgi:hypothetical protein
VLHQQGNAFFREKNKQKTLTFCGIRQGQHAPQYAKVFWFFFSKKNILSYWNGYHLKLTNRKLSSVFGVVPMPWNANRRT